jgi:CTD nuclear envelope phosphatase 1
MNSLNILSSRVISQAAGISRPRSRSQGEALTPIQSEELLRGRSYIDEKVPTLGQFGKHDSAPDAISQVEGLGSDEPIDESRESTEGLTDEKTALLAKDTASEASTYQSRLRRLVKRIADALTALMTTIGAPVVYVVRCFQEDDGRYSPLMPFKRVRRKLTGRGGKKSTSTAVGLASAPDTTSWDEKTTKNQPQDSELRHSYSNESLKSTTSESESDKKRPTSKKDSRRLLDVSDEPVSRRQSIRIKLHNEESLKKARSKGTANASSPPLTVDNIKSPTSSASSMKPTRYPHAPKAPRPLVPRRQPSYSNILSRRNSLRLSPDQQQKTLVIDLDETLIHSLAKGGRMSSGHMVEVKLNTPVALAPPQGGQPAAVLGPQHPILYYVHKRPHCDEFLRKISKWYKLVVFTASVQEYADPVINLLESEKKYFAERYYRQHCTLRNGGYIKDLSTVEPDLSKVMILDNSPVSYIFHEGMYFPHSCINSKLTR